MILCDVYTNMEGEGGGLLEKNKNVLKQIKRSKFKVFVHQKSLIPKFYTCFRLHNIHSELPAPTNLNDYSPPKNRFQTRFIKNFDVLL